MKRLIQTVDLVFFRDNATGDYGLTHKETYEDNYGNGFNAFWGGMLIFHDVFEHSHEFTNKYFRGDYALNVGGEMAAMGKMMYFIDELEIYNRLTDRMKWRGHGELMTGSTIGEVQEAISSGYCSFGHVLESNVPYQKPVENGELEYHIKDYYKKAKDFKVSDDGDQEKEFGEQYKKSVTFRKIADLHRYGYRQAAKLVPNNWDNRETLVNFIKVWDSVCNSISAEEMQSNFKGLTVKIYRDENGRISWKGIFESNFPSEIMDATIDENTRGFAMEDYYIIEEETKN